MFFRKACLVTQSEGLEKHSMTRAEHPVLCRGAEQGVTVVPAWIELCRFLEHWILAHPREELTTVSFASAGMCRAEQVTMGMIQERTPPAKICLLFPNTCSPFL